MSEQIVDWLETVEVENAHRKGCRVVRPVRYKALDLVEEAAVIAKAGQRVGEGEVRTFPVSLPGDKRSLHRFSCYHAGIAGTLAANPLGNVSLTAHFRGIRPWTVNLPGTAQKDGCGIEGLLS